MRALLFILAATLVSSCATAAPRGASLSGQWTGAYICAQGLTALTLTIDQTDRGGAHLLNATFAFSAHPENPGVPPGSFTMRGTFNPRDRTVLLWSQDWLERPGDYVMVNLNGHLTRRGGLDHIAGHVDFPDDPSACTDFEVRRAPSTIASGGRDVQSL